MQTEQSALCRCSFHYGDRTLRSDRGASSRDRSQFQCEFLWQLGAGEAKCMGCRCRGGGGARLERRVSAGLRVLADLGGEKKSPGQSVHQPVDRRLRTTAQLPLVLLRCACACGGLGGGNLRG